MQKQSFNRSFVISKETIDLLNEVPIFDKLGYNEIKILSRFMKPERYKAGEVLFHEGDKGDYVFFVVDGKLDVLKTSKTSDDVVIATIGKGRSIGEMTIVDDYPRSATVRTHTNVSLIILTRDNFEHILKEYPQIGIKVLKGLTRQVSLNLRKTSSRLAEYMFPLN
ncbi:MAG: cyclic nucleotide-binding domain-containing protein [Candidatus Latescibacteria bacterium]|nr:cyclic nucleotide-binding domain-containing protein [Candidatus Latescibacterota bacterium]